MFLLHPLLLPLGSLPSTEDNARATVYPDQNPSHYMSTSSIFQNYAMEVSWVLFLT